MKEYAKIRSIIFVSHTATHPNYRLLGIVENLTDTLRGWLVDQHPAVYCLMTSHRLANFVIQRHGMEIMAEVFYKDYEDNGRKVFAKLSEQEVSAKALITFL